MKSAVVTSIALALSLLVGSCDQTDETTPTSLTAPPQSTTEKSIDLPEGAADKSDSKTVNVDPVIAAKPPQATVRKTPSVAPVPVPAARIPVTTASNRAVPSVNPLATGTTLTAPVAIAQTFKTKDRSQAIVPYFIANRQAIGACQDIRFEPDFVNMGSNTYRVAENTYLVHLTCASTAYQVLQEYYLYKTTANTPVVTNLPITYFYSDLQGKLIQETERTMAGYSEFDPTTKTVSIFTKGRGLGDCGSLGFYKLVGSELQLDRFLAKDECDGNYIEPIQYPQVYP
ncbi:MAG: DUF1176 domain-containing protein [Limnothrix sp.]